MPPAEGPLPGTIASGSVSQASRLIHTADGAPFDAAALSQLKTEAVLEGRSFRQLGPGEVLFGPVGATASKGGAP